MRWKYHLIWVKINVQCDMNLNSKISRDTWSDFKFSLKCQYGVQIKLFISKVNFQNTCYASYPHENQWIDYQFYLVNSRNFFLIFLRCSILTVTSNIDLNGRWSHQCWGVWTFMCISFHKMVWWRSNISRCWAAISLFIPRICWATCRLIFCMRLLNIFISIINIFFFIFITSLS